MIQCLTMLSKRGDDVQATIYTSKISKQLQLDLHKYQQQYATITVNTFKQAHDRFVILDNQDVYHLGASLKDLGKKWFAFYKMQMPASEILNKLGAKKMINKNTKASFPCSAWECLFRTDKELVYGA